MNLIKSFFRFWKMLFFSVLGFFGLIDENRSLSRTNVILYIFVYKFATVPLATSSINELVGAVVALGGVGGAIRPAAARVPMVLVLPPVMGA